MASTIAAPTQPSTSDMKVPFTAAWLKGPRQTSFYTRSYLPDTGSPRAALVFAHGFVEHVGRYEHVFPVYAKKGIAVFAFDMRGFGRTALDNERSAGSSYGKTNSADQRADLRWALSEAEKQWAGVPLFLMGHSMGGALVLSYTTVEKPTNLTGVIATSPLIAQATPVSWAVRKAGKLLAMALPNIRVPGAVDNGHLSSDPSVGEAYNKDPYVIQSGTLKGISTMLEAGEILSSTGARDWPKSLPLLLVHGTADKVTSHLASKKFYETIVADDKKLSLYDGGFHELQNEPNGVSDKLIGECTSWIEAHLPRSSQSAAEAIPTSDEEPAPAVSKL